MIGEVGGGREEEITTMQEKNERACKRAAVMVPRQMDSSPEILGGHVRAEVGKRILDKIRAVILFLP